jgi:hypothetical protein
MSTHVDNVSAHNPTQGCVVVYSVYERLRPKHPLPRIKITFQLAIVEVWLCIKFFSIIRAKFASFGREVKGRLVQEL